MTQVKSFEPVIGTAPRVMILGSMPGVASLEAQQYYAHPRNAFWPIMAELLNVTWKEDYLQRLQQLQQHPVILWDVLRACRREGSLDSAIKRDEYLANDISGLLDIYRDVRLIVFNGATAEKFFRQSVVKTLPYSADLQFIRLPSTSPAHASKKLSQKLADWSVLEEYLK